LDGVWQKGAAQRCIDHPGLDRAASALRQLLRGNPVGMRDDLYRKRLEPIRMRLHCQWRHRGTGFPTRSPSPGGRGP